MTLGRPFQLFGRLPHRDLFTVSAVVLLSATSFASTPQGRASTKEAFASLESAQIQYLTPEQCQAEYVVSEFTRHTKLTQLQSAGAAPSHNDFGGSQLTDWIPTAQTGRVLSQGCETSALEKAIIGNSSSVQQQATAIDTYFKRCDGELRRNNPKGLLALFRLEAAQYNFCDQPHMKKVIIKLPNGDVIRGILALKSDSKPHPFVIAKCGALCDPSDASLRFIMMHLFDESPFDVLVLANVTGPSFARDNGFIALGGLYEGQEILQVAQMLKNSPLQKRISSIHAVGMSLGSHASLFASMMNSYNIPADGKPLLTSTLAACPVVDLEASMKSLFSNSIDGVIARSSYDNAVGDVVSTFPGMQSLFQSNITTEQIPDAVADAATAHLRDLKPGWTLAPFENAHIQNRAQFWKQNQFLNYLTNPMTTPTLAIAGLDDQIVPIKSNTERLKNVLAQDRTLPASTLAAVTVASGDHCAFGEVYGWQTASALFRSYVLSRSPEMQARHHFNVAYLTQALYNQQNVVYAGEKQFVQSFSFAKGESAITINYKILMPFREGCSDIPEFAGPLVCYREQSTKIPFNAIDLRGTDTGWAHAPTTDAEAQSMTRWANVHMKLLSPDGKPLAYTTSLGAELRWESYN